MSSAEKLGKAVNGIALGVNKVFDKTEETKYLEQRFAHWHVTAPSGLKPHCQELPPVHPEESLARIQISRQVKEKQLESFRKCAKEIMDSYFPPIGDESVVKDTHTCLAKPYGNFAPGTAVVIRKTSKAVLYFIDPSISVEFEGMMVTNIRSGSPPTRLLMAAASPIDEAKIATKILGQFTCLLPGPAGTVAKFGIELINAILGMAGSSGPSWEEIKAMMRQVVREELITNDLEFIQADYESVMKWGDIQYLPNKNTQPKNALWEMLRPQIDLVSRDINLLLQTNHRIPGFGLLLLGVDIYLGLLQEQVALGYAAKLKDAGDQWATNMLKVWEEVQKDRHNQITVNRYSYGVYVPPGDVMTCYFWQWADKKTGESRGSRSGPWQAGGKHDTSESECRADAEAHYQTLVLPKMITTFGDPLGAADSWRKIRIPEKLTVTEYVHA